MIAVYGRVRHGASQLHVRKMADCYFYRIIWEINPNYVSTRVAAKLGSRDVYTYLKVMPERLPFAAKL